MSESLISQGQVAHLSQKKQTGKMGKNLMNIFKNKKLTEIEKRIEDVEDQIGAERAFKKKASSFFTFPFYVKHKTRIDMIEETVYSIEKKLETLMHVEKFLDKYFYKANGEWFLRAMEARSAALKNTKKTNKKFKEVLKDEQNHKI